MLDVVFTVVLRAHSSLIDYTWSAHTVVLRAHSTLLLASVSVHPSIARDCLPRTSKCIYLCMHPDSPPACMYAFVSYTTSLRERVLYIVSLNNKPAKKTPR